MSRIIHVAVLGNNKIMTVKLTTVHTCIHWNHRPGQKTPKPAFFQRSQDCFADTAQFIADSIKFDSIVSLAINSKARAVTIN